MTKIRITQSGMENFTGFMGEIEFEGGESVDEVSKMQAQRLRSSFKVETLDGVDPGAPAVFARAKAGEEEKVKYKDARDNNLPPTNYTLEQLEQIADKDGIAGVREFAESYNVKSNSIVGLIEKLMVLKGED